MGKGSWRRPFDARAFGANYDRVFGRNPSQPADVTTSVPASHSDHMVPVPGCMMCEDALDEARECLADEFRSAWDE